MDSSLDMLKQQQPIFIIKLFGKLCFCFISRFHVHWTLGPQWRCRRRRRRPRQLGRRRRQQRLLGLVDEGARGVKILGGGSQKLWLVAVAVVKSVTLLMLMITSSARRGKIVTIIAIKTFFFEVISGRKIFPNVSKKCNFNLRRFKAPDDIFLTAGSRHSSTELVFMLLPKLPWVWISPPYARKRAALPVD